MRKFLFLILFLFVGQSSFAYFDMSTPVEGNSIATDDLQYKVLEDMYELVYPLNPICTHYKVKNTQIIHYPYDVKKKKGKYVKGYWKELWSIDYCGSSVQIPITFYIKKKKTTYFIDKNFLVD